MNIITTIPIWQDNAAQAETLLDFIYNQSGQQTIGSVLLAVSTGVHAEMKERLKISATLAFKHVYEVEIRPLADTRSPKPAWVNSAFHQVAMEVSENYRWPFLWLEPDVVPTKPDWRETVGDAYLSQPKGYFGTQMKTVAPQGKPSHFFMSRVGVYPNTAVSDYPTTEFKAPFEIACSAKVIPKLTPTKLFQQVSIQVEDDLQKVRPDAVLVHGDKQGILLRSIARSGPKEPVGEKVIVTVKQGETGKTTTTPRLSRRMLREMQANGEVPL